MLERLFSPIDIGPVALRNRIYSTPHATMFESDERNNLPGERLANYLAERAKGGAALVEVSMAIVGEEIGMSSPDTAAHFGPLNSGHPMILSGRWPLRGGDPRIVKGYSMLAKAVHEHGGRCFIELASGGTNVGNEKGVTRFPWPSSAILGLPFTPREMTEEDIEKQIEAYGVAAKYVKDSGLDGVDLLASHGSLISEFLSQLMNRRKDKWGGSIGNNSRFLSEIVNRVRECTKGEIAIALRLLGDEKFEGGYGPKEAGEIAHLVDGRVDMITVDQSHSPQQDDWQAVPMYVESGYNLPISDAIRSRIKTTRLGVVGKFTDPTYAESLIANNRTDMVAMTRALIADPELPNKAKQGRLEEIRPCIGALQDCWGRMNRGLPISCTVNPAVGREATWGMGTLTKAGRKKRVLIVGAGPAGLETARIAAEKGHSVVIYEKAHSVGGQAVLAGKLPRRENIRAILVWLEQQVKSLNVEIKYGMEITSDPDVVRFVLDEEKPDAVVIACGSHPVKDGFQPYTFHVIDGWDLPLVSTDLDILDGRGVIGKKAIVADTLNFIEAPGVAEYLAKRGADVEVVTPFDNIGLELHPLNHWDHLLPRLFEANVKVSPFTWIKQIRRDSVVLYNIYSKKEWVTTDVDNVVLITGKIQDDTLYDVFKGCVAETYLVGDAKIGGARIGSAFYDAQDVARLI